MSFPSLQRAGVVLTLGLLAVAGCKEKLSPDKIVSTIEIMPHSARLYAAGDQVIFTSTLTTEAGTAGEGIDVGYISRDPSLVQVNSAGVAKALKKGGSTYVIAQAGGKADSALVEVPETVCGTTAPTALAVGQVATGIGQAGFCAAASSGEYAIIVHNNSLAALGSSSVELSAVAVENPPTGGAQFSKVATGAFGAQLRTWRRDVAAEMRHRRAEAAMVAPFAATAQAWYANRTRRANRVTTAPAVGDQMPGINVNLGSCSTPRTDITGRVAAVSNSAIVIADPRNPSGGYTDAEYNDFAQMFDSVIYALDVAAFGAPSDIDNNQRVLLVFTKAINELTPAGANYYVGGLTHSRDLVPKTAAVGQPQCAASNEAEMFYLLVPDPSGTVNGNVFLKSFVTSVTDATVAHEFQHLINFARRRYINPGQSNTFEELWLNEGLSHMAEELLYYRRSGKAPRTNIGGTQVFASQAAFNLFATYMAGDFLNYDEYAFTPNETSPFEAGDEVATRGATWAFLRYAADQKAATDGTLWFDLVNSGESGITNVQNRLGLNSAGLLGMLRDFTISVYTDDFVPGVAAKYTQPSWDMRSIYPGLQQPFLWPLRGTGIADGQTLSATIQAGGFRVYRFTGMSGADSYIRATGASGGALPAGMTLSVVRTK